MTGLELGDLPTRPGEIPHTVSLRGLADRFHAHALLLLENRHGIGEPLSPEARTAHAVAELACAHALADRVLAGRWVAVRDALSADAGLERVAAAMDTEPDGVAEGLRGWADGQLRYGHITPAAHARVIRLLDGGAR